jgi:hypothetical protein
LSSEHSAIIITVNNKVTIKDKLCTLHNARTNWPYFKELLMTILDNSIPLKSDDDIVSVVECFNHIVKTVWNAILTCSNLNNNTEYSFSIKEQKKGSYVSGGN